MAKKDNLTVNKIWASLRISLGFIFLWAFADKLIGLGVSTCYDKAHQVTNYVCSDAFVQGGSPTTGYLSHATGPLASFYTSLAGSNLIDVVFMIALLLIGAGLMLGIAMRLSTLGGVLLLLMMWGASFPPAQNPLIDDHVIYALALIGLCLNNDNQVWGFRKYWNALSLVKKYKWLQ